MSNSTSPPSWQSLQRQGGTPSPAAYPQSGSGMDAQAYQRQSQQQQQQSWRPTNTRIDSGGIDSQRQQPFPSSQPRERPSTGTTSSTISSGTGVSTNNTSMGKSASYASQMDAAGLQNGGSTPPASSQNSQQQPHRRTQSLRPMSAFQPLEHVDSGYQMAGNGAANGQRPASPTGSVTRSIRTAAAPLTFKSPELRSALGLQDAQSKKIYMEGYLSRRDHLNADGKPLAMTDPKKRWHLCFVQLSGTVLSVWSVQQMEEAARQGTEVPPSYINVTDCFVDYIGTITETPQEVPGTRGRYENVFAVNTAGQNRILFGVEGAVGRRLVQAWVNGIRLASWEKVRLEEIYTGSLVRARLGAVSAQQATSGPGGAPGDVEMSIKSPLSKGGRMEGWVKARFMGSTEWKKSWLVLTEKGAEGAAVTTDANAETASVTSPKSSFWRKLKAGDRSSIMGSPSTPALADTGLSSVEVPPGSNGAPGLACFYESKKAKKPFATLAYASHAFAVYPSRPELVEGSSLFKVEGAFPLSTTISATNRNRQTGWVMIMPELESNGNKGANAEMMKWCIAFMDAFHLYGRPTQFQWDARNPVSPFFAYPIGPYKDRLFLDRELAEFLDIREERHLANRNNLHGIMSARMRGERTPILPPLPQPNAESTRNLNGPQGKEGGASASQPPPPAANGNASSNGNGNGNGNGNTNDSALPPLNFGQRDGSAASSSSGGSGRLPGTISGDAPFASRGALDSIGERSREGSVMTTLNTPVTPSTNEIPEQMVQQRSQGGEVKAPVHPSQSQSNSLPVEAVGGAGAGLAAAAIVGAATVKTNNSNNNSNNYNNNSSSDSNSNGYQPARSSSVSTRKSQGNGARSSVLLSETAERVSAPPTTASRTADQTSNSAVTEPWNSSKPPPAAPSTQLGQMETAPIAAAATAIPPPASQPRTLQASGRGAEAAELSSAAGTTPGIARKNSDPYGSYDEGALYYISSMSEQLPQQNNQMGGTTREQAIAAAPSQAESASEHSTAYNHRGQSTSTSAAAAASLQPRQQVVRPMSTQIEGIDQDAMAAYSFLDQPASPNLGRTALPQVNAAPTVAPVAAPIVAPAANLPTIREPASVASAAPVQQPPQSYPSTFGGNKKVQERKIAAQAQAQAHQDALTRPGRAGGAKKGLKQVGGQRNAWQDESEDEDDDEEDDEEDEEQQEESSADQSMAPTSLDSQPAALPNRLGSGVTSLSASSEVPTPPSKYSPSLQARNAVNVPPSLYGNAPRQTQRSVSPQYSQQQSSSQQQQQLPSRQSMFNQHLGANHDENRTAKNQIPASTSVDTLQRNTFVQLSQEEQPGAMTAAFQPHGLLQAGAQDKVERSAKQQEALARAEGTHMVSVDSKPPPPQAGLLGAISAHERDRKKDGGLGATLTERERDRVQAERRQREEDMMRMQQQQYQQQQMMAGGGQQPGWGGGMPFNPMMWQQMQMMSMMNPQMMGINPMFAGQGSGSQLGHGGSGSPDAAMAAQHQAQQQAQMMAAQAAQQAYMQAMSQHGGSMMSGEGGGGGGGGAPSPPMMPPAMGMMPFNPYMSMYGAPQMPGFPGFMGAPMGSEVGQQMPATPSPRLQNRSQDRNNSNNSPLRR